MREIRKSKQSKHLFPAQNKQIFGYSLYLPLLAKITVVAVHERAKHSKTYFIGFVGLEEDVSICVNIFTYAVDCVLTQIQNLKQTYCNLSLGAQKK